MNTVNKKIKAGWPEILLLTISLLLTFAVCEYLVRVLPIGDMMGWSMVPSVKDRVRTAGSTDEIRVLAVGDSQTEWRDATGHSYVRVAQKELEIAGKKIDVVNLAEAGTAMTSYFGNILNYSDRLKPDIVVLGLYMGNDIIGANPPLATPEGRRAAAAFAKADGDKRHSDKKFYKQSLLLNYAYRIAKAHLPQLRSGVFDGLIKQVKDERNLDDAYVAERLRTIDPKIISEARSETINPWLLAYGIFDPDYYRDISVVAPGTGIAEQVDSVISDLSAIAAFCRERDMELVVVLIPSAPWVSERYHDFFQSLGSKRLGSTKEKIPLIEKLKSALGTFDVATVSPLEKLRKAKDDTYLPRDLHLNRYGHELIGKALAETLASAALKRVAQKEK